MREVYKVLNTSDGKLISAFAGNLEYKVDEWTRPVAEHTRIFCFDTYSNASYWLDEFTSGRHNPTFKIRRGFVPESDIEADPRKFFVYPQCNKISDWLDDPDNFVETCYIIPRGTLAVKKIKIL